MNTSNNQVSGDRGGATAYSETTEQKNVVKRVQKRALVKLTSSTTLAPNERLKLSALVAKPKRNDSLCFGCCGW